MKSNGDKNKAASEAASKRNGGESKDNERALPPAALNQPGELLARIAADAFQEP